MILYLALGDPELVAGRVGGRRCPSWSPEALPVRAACSAAILGLVLYNSAVLAEIMRAGIQSLDRGQGEAARALGMTYRQSMRFVILPQGLRRMVPATVSQLITLNKDTTLVSIVAIQEVMRHARIVTGFNFFGGVQAPILQVFLFVGLLFVIVNLTLSRLSRRLEVRERKRTAAVRPMRRARRAGCLSGFGQRARRGRADLLAQVAHLGVGRQRERALAGGEAVGDAVGARQRVRVARPGGGGLGRELRRLLAGA